MASIPIKENPDLEKLDVLSGLTELSLSKEELGSIFVDALLEVVSTVSGFAFYGVAPETDTETETENENDFDGVTGIMSLIGGKKNIMIFLSASENDLRILCSYMSGLALDEIKSEDVYDTLCELVNMTAGNAKLRIGGTNYMFTLSLPFAITGDNMTIITKKRVNVFSKILGNGEISIRLKIVY